MTASPPMFDGTHDRDDPFDQAIKALAYGTLPDHEAKALLADEMIEQTYTACKALIGTLLGLLSESWSRYETGIDVDQGWVRRTKSLKQRLDVLLIRLEPEVKAARRRAHAPRPESVLIHDLRRLRAAIHEHRRATLADDLEPSDADLELWAAVESEPAT